MKVIIVGAGIGGLSAGIGLRRAGHDVLVGALATLETPCSNCIKSFGVPR